jgi:soluble lytic murein transglycosylase-like protein
MNEYYEFEDEFDTASYGGGVLPGLWMPPLVVVIIGLLIGFITSGAVITQSVTAASIPNEEISQVLNNNAEDLNLINSDDSGLANFYTPEVLYWKQNILSWSERSGLDSNMIATVMQIESCGDPRALSSAGAMGLFQVMPFHFISGDDPYEPDTNSLRGMAYLVQSLNASNGVPRLAFAGYNGGISVIHKSESSWASETQRYAYWGSGIYDEASQGVEISQRLQEWLSHGGASLCRQAAERLGIDP